MAMDQYLYIPFLGGWTSIYQLFWCSPGVPGFDILPFEFFEFFESITDFVLDMIFAFHDGEVMKNDGTLLWGLLMAMEHAGNMMDLLSTGQLQDSPWDPRWVMCLC